MRQTFVQRLSVRQTRMPLLIFTFVLSNHRFEQPLCETVLRGSLAWKGWLKIFLLSLWFKDICLANNIIKFTMPPSRAKQRQAGFLPVVKYLDTLIMGFLSCRATYCMHIGIHLGYSCLVQNTGQGAVMLILCVVTGSLSLTGTFCLFLVLLNMAKGVKSQILSSLWT